MHEVTTDILIVGGGLGGVAAALAAVRAGRRVLLIEETPWLGGQLTSQAVPPDEHPWIESELCSTSYGELRRRIREYYHRNYPIAEQYVDDEQLNPGLGRVSRLCHEPAAAAAVLDEMVQPWVSSRRLDVRRGWRATRANRRGERVSSVLVERIADRETHIVRAAMVVDATETGDLLHLANVPHVIGAEGRSETGELHALPDSDPTDQQAISWCYALDYSSGEDHTIAKPDGYEYWRDTKDPRWPDSQLSWFDLVPSTLEKRHLRIFGESPHQSEVGDGFDLWRYRRVLAKRTFAPGFLPAEVTIVNWPQTDYWESPLLGVDDAVRARTMERARDLSLSFLYWMQTAAPRTDGGTGYPELRLRPDVVGTVDGLAMRPYIRESRRIRADFTVTEGHIGKAMRADEAGPALFADSVGIGWYRIDLHPSTSGRNYVDVDCYPFQIPMGALLAQGVSNMLPACKNIGTTHITNGAYRLHPVEWSVGEAVGTLSSLCLEADRTPRQVRGDAGLLKDLQDRLRRSGVSLAWPDDIARGAPDHDRIDDGAKGPSAGAIT